MVSEIVYRWNVDLLLRRKGDKVRYGSLPKGYHLAHTLSVCKHSEGVFVHKLWASKKRRRTNLSKSRRRNSLRTTIEVRLKDAGETVQTFYLDTLGIAEFVAGLWAKSGKNRSYKFIDHISNR